MSQPGKLGFVQPALTERSALTNAEVNDQRTGMGSKAGALAVIEVGVRPSHIK